MVLFKPTSSLQISKILITLRKTNNMSIESTNNVRRITKSEKAKIRRTHFSLIPFLLITSLILFVIYIADSLPLIYRIAGGVIGVATLLIFSKKQITLEKELKLGQVEVVRGLVTDKYKFGGNKKGRGGGVSVSRSGGSKSMSTYIIVIGGKKYWVRSKTYKKTIKGAYSEMVWLPKSSYVISIEKI